MNLEKYIVKEFKILPTSEQIKQIRKLSKEVEVIGEDYKLCVEFWLKEFHIGWDFGAMQGKSLKSIIVKIKKRLKEYNKPITDKTIFDTFVFICENLPEFYIDKDLNVINSSFNTIVEQIKRPNGKDKQNNSKITGEQLASIYAEKFNKEK